MRFRPIFVVFYLFALVQSGFAQDKVVLLNGDTLQCQLIKLSSGKISVKQESIEREMATDFVSKMILQNGKQTVFREIPSTLDFAKRFTVLEYSEERVSEIKLLFPNVERRDFMIRNISENSILPLDPFIKSTQTDREHEDGYLKEFTTLGYGCNAFLALVRPDKGEMHYTFFSNPVTSEIISRGIINKSYKLIDSQTVGAGLAIADMTLKSFTMDFKEDGTCNFVQGGKATLLEYQISENGELTFRDPKKKNKGTTYKVVFLDSGSMRYTQFSSAHQLIARKVEVSN